LIVLARIDDRLIHGQVVLGWGRVLKPDRYLVVDDEVASSEWEKSLYASAVQDETSVSILTIDEAIEALNGESFRDEKVILLVKSPQTMLSLVEKGFNVSEVNVGGLHYSEGKDKVLDNVYLNNEERLALRELVKKGITLEARPLPDSERVILNHLVV